MSDVWPFPPSSPPPPIMHHSSVSQSSHFFTSLPSPGNHLQVTSPHLPPPPQVTSPHLPHPQVASPHLYQSQVTSPHLPAPPQGTSPHLPHPQVASPHLYQPQVTSPHLPAPPQVTSPHLPHPQVASPHLYQPQVTSPHLPPPQVTSPHLYHPQVTSPHLPPPPQVISPHLPHPQVTSPHLYQPQVTSPHLFSNPNPDPGPDHPAWFRSESSDPSYLLRSCRYSNQNQTSAHLDVQNQNHTHSLPYNTGPCDTPGPVQDTWRLQSSGGEDQGTWISAEHYCNTQFFYDGYHDNYAPQPFCSPTTPGPSPHYPQTQAVSSPGPQMYPGTETLCLTSDPGHLTTQHHLQSHTELIQDQPVWYSESGFSPLGREQDVSSSAQTAGLSSGQEERRTDHGAEALKSRLLCLVCKRDFRSLPALNGHMRSHSGSRAATGSNKGEDQPSVSMVKPIQSRGSSRPRQRGQKRSSPATGGAAPLYCSLLHQEEEEEEEEEKAGAEDSNPGDGVVAGGDGEHYTPPPMLCPLRVGPGLYCSLATRRQQKVQAAELHNTHDGLDDLVARETAPPPPGTVTNKPRINEGRGFQAEIPPLQGRGHATSDSHNALLLWAPWDELERPVDQQRVEALLAMARSSVVPGGGASSEHALHVLSECRGDFLLTVEKLLSTPDTTNNNNNNNNNNQAAQQYTRSKVVKMSKIS